MTTAISAIGVPARARGRALHQRAPLFRCRPKRGANVRKILVMAVRVSSGAAANRNRLRRPAQRPASPTEQLKNTKTRPAKVLVSSDVGIATESSDGSKRGKCADQF